MAGMGRVVWGWTELSSETLNGLVFAPSEKDPADAWSGVPLRRETSGGSAGHSG